MKNLLSKKSFIYLFIFLFFFIIFIINIFFFLFIFILFYFILFYFILFYFYFKKRSLWNTSTTKEGTKIMLEKNFFEIFEKHINKEEKYSIGLFSTIRNMLVGNESSRERLNNEKTMKLFLEFFEEENDEKLKSVICDCIKIICLELDSINFFFKMGGIEKIYRVVCYTHSSKLIINCLGFTKLLILYIYIFFFFL